MADFKSYNVVYNITANAAEAAATLRELAASAERLGKGRHMERFNAHVRQLAQYSKSITEAMNSFSPRVDMRTFKTQLRLMEHAVSISAQNMRAMIQTALNGTPGQFEKALQGKGSWAAVASRAMVAQEKQLKKDLTKAKANLDNLTKTLTSGTVSERGNDGKLLTRVLPKEELAAYRNRAKIAKAEVAGLENSLAALQNNLTVLGRNTSPTAITTSLNAVGNAAENASKLNEMANAVKKWNKAIVGMPKSQTYKITLKAQDNTKAAIEKIRLKIEQLKAEASTIFFGGASSGGTAKRTPNKRPADVMSSQELKNSKELLDKIRNLAYTRSNGLWSKSMKTESDALRAIATKSLNLPADTPLEQLITPLQQRYRQELQKYNDWRAKSAAAAKQNKAASAAPSAPTIPTPQIVPIPQQQPVTVGTKLDRTGMLERAKSGYETLQKLAGRRPITVRSRFNGGGAGFDMSRSINTLQELANTRPVSLASRLNRTGILERAWSGHKTLQTLADQRPIQVKSQFNSAGLRFGLGRALVELQNIANARPIRIGATVSTTGTIPTGGVSSRAATPRAASAPKPGVYPSGSSAAVMPPQLPVINSRTTTGTRNNPVHTRNIYDGSVFNATKRWLYPLTGNTSFGARTPAIVDMAKGMGVMMAVGGAMGAVGSSFSQSVDYQNMMTTTRAILGRSYEGNNFEKDIADMEKIVRREGVLTKFTAPEVAGAAKYLAMAGMDVNTIKAAIKPVTNIALAGDIDLPTAADKMTNIMTAFQMRTPSDFTRASDVLTNTFTKSNTNMLQLAEAAQYAAPIAAARGMKLEDMMALVGVMSDAGIQSSMAGTTLRMMMNNIYKPSKTQMPTWEKLAKLGVTRTDANGNWLSVIDILDQIAQKVPVNGKAGESLADIMGNLFRVTSAAGATQLAKNITKVKSLRDSNINSYGAAESIRESRINNVRGKWAQVSSQFTENILQIFEKPEMQQKIMGLLDKFRDVLAKPETIKSLESVFDVLLSMANFAGKMAEIGAKLVGSAPNLVKAMLQFQFIATMLGSYVIAPIQQLINTIGMFIPARMLGKKSAANTIVSTVAGATTTSSTAGAIAGGVLASRVARDGSVMGLMPNGTSKLLRTRSAGVLAARRQAELGNILNATNMRQMRYEQIANRLSYSIEQQQLSNPDEHQSIYWMGNARVRAANHAAREAEAAAVLRNRIAPVTQAEVMARYERMYGHAYHGGFLGRTGAGMARGFNAGRALTFASLVPSLSGIGGALTNVMSKVATGFGMLLSPVGGAAIGLGGLVWAIKKARDRINEGKSEREKSEAEDAPGRERAFKEATKDYGITANQSSGVSVLGAKTNTRGIENGRLNPTIFGATGYNRLYKNQNKKGVNGYIREVYDKFIKNNSQYMYGRQLTFEEFKDRMWQGTQVGMVKNGRLAAQNTLKAGREAAVYRAVMERNSSGYNNANNEMKSAINAWYKLPLNERERQYPQLIKQLSSIRDRFNPEKGIDISGRDFRGIRLDDLATSKQGIQAVWNILNGIIGNINSTQSGDAFARGTLGFQQPFSSSWLESMDTILSSQQFTVTDKFGDPQRVTLEFKRGVANWDKFAKEMQKLQVDFSGTVGQHLAIITEIAKAVANDPNLKDLAAVRQYLSGLLTYITSYDSKFKLSLLRDEMYNSIAPMPNVPVFKSTGENSSLPQSIRKPSQTVVNSSYWSQMNQQQGERDRQLQLKRFGISRDQGAYSNSYQSKSQGKNSGPMLFSLNTPLVNIQNANVNSKEDAERIGNIAAEQFVNALSIISGSVNTQTEYS